MDRQIDLTLALYHWISLGFGPKSHQIKLGCFVGIDKYR
jgi:hypothetical protein